jgi:hypothetical protein
MADGGKGREKFYKWVKIGGILSFIPFILAAGPFAGYVFGVYMEEKFGFPHYAMLISVTIGIAAGAFETARIIKMALRAQEKD